MTNQPNANSTTEANAQQRGYSLDLFSTTPTTDSEPDKSSKYPRCYKNAPVIAVPPQGENRAICTNHAAMIGIVPGVAN
jgi:hypothetical protein